MEHKYTSEEKILQYIYNELDSADTHDIKNKIEDNYDLKNEYQVYNKLLRYLDRLIESPSQNVVEKIMDYSKNYSKEKSSL